MAVYSDNLLDERNGLPIEGAELWVYTSLGVEATLTDALDQPLTQPLVTDADGGFEYKADDGVYRHDFWKNSVMIFRDNRIIVGVPGVIDVAVGAFGETLVANATAADARSDLGINSAAELAASGGSALSGFIQSGASAVATTAQAKMRQVVTFEDWGVTGDGSAGDLVKMNAAISEAPAGSVLRATRQTYLLNGQLTIARDNLEIDLGKSTLKAKDGTVFEHVLYGTGRTNVTVRGGTIDANRAGRTSGQNIRYTGGFFTLSTDCHFVGVTAKNAVGYSSIPGIGLTLSGCVRSTVNSCNIYDCGGTSGTDGADGIFVSGENCLIIGCITDNCTDTGQVIESSNNSGIIGGTAKNCNAGGAITNATNFAKRGNFIKGLSVLDWNSSVTGGVQIGCPAATTGDLLDTDIDVNVSAVTGGKGTGPAINVRKVGTGKTKRLRINAIINGASTQGIVVDGDDVFISASILGTTAACIQFATGSSGTVSDSRLFGGSFGVYLAGTSVVAISDSDIVANGTQTHGIYAADTSSASALFNRISGSTIALTGKDGGATLNAVSQVGAAIHINGTQVITTRETGWTAGTGTANKGAFATYAGVTHTGSYVQATVQALDDATRNASQRVKAIEDALRTHGLIN